MHNYMSSFGRHISEAILFYVCEQKSVIIRRRIVSSLIIIIMHLYSARPCSHYGRIVPEHILKVPHESMFK